MSGEPAPPPKPPPEPAGRPESRRTRNKEFEIVRDLMAGRVPTPAEPTYQTRTLAPAPFREIDGEVLARQYVAYRKFLESEAEARAKTGDDVVVSGGRGPQLRGERRPAAGDGQASGWFAGLSRLWRR